MNKEEKFEKRMKKLSDEEKLKYLIKNSGDPYKKIVERVIASKLIDDDFIKIRSLDTFEDSGSILEISRTLKTEESKLKVIEKFKNTDKSDLIDELAWILYDDKNLLKAFDILKNNKLFNYTEVARLMKNDENIIKLLEKIDETKTISENERTEIIIRLKNDNTKRELLNTIQEVNNKYIIVLTSESDELKLDFLNKYGNEIEETKKASIIGNLEDDNIKTNLINEIEDIDNKASIVTSFKDDFAKISFLEKNEKQLSDKYKLFLVESLKDDDEKTKLLDKVDENDKLRVIETFKDEDKMYQAMMKTKYKDRMEDLRTTEIIRKIDETSRYAFSSWFDIMAVLRNKNIKQKNIFDIIDHAKKTCIIREIAKNSDPKVIKRLLNTVVYDDRKFQHGDIYSGNSEDMYADPRMGIVLKEPEKERNKIIEIIKNNPHVTEEILNEINEFEKKEQQEKKKDTKIDTKKEEESNNQIKENASKSYDAIYLDPIIQRFKDKMEESIRKEEGNNLKDKFSEFIKVQVSRYCKMSDELWNVLINDEELIRMALATNSNIPEKFIDELKEDESEKVREFLVDNSSININKKIDMIYDDSWIIRQILLEKVETNKAELDESELKKIINNRNTNNNESKKNELIEKLDAIEDKDEKIKSIAELDDDNLKVELTKEFEDFEDKLSIIATIKDINKSYEALAKTEIGDKIQDARKTANRQRIDELLKENKWYIDMQLINNSNIKDEDTWLIEERTPYAEVIEEMLRNPNTSESTINAIDNRVNRKLRNDTIDFTSLDKYKELDSNTFNKNINKLIAKNPNTSKEILKRYSLYSNNIEVKIALTQNSNVTMEMLDNIDESMRRYEKKDKVKLAIEIAKVKQKGKIDEFNKTIKSSLPRKKINLNAPIENIKVGKETKKDELIEQLHVIDKEKGSYADEYQIIFDKNIINDIKNNKINNENLNEFNLFDIKHLIENKKTSNEVIQKLKDINNDEINIMLAENGKLDKDEIENFMRGPNKKIKDAILFNAENVSKIMDKEIIDSIINDKLTQDNAIIAITEKSDEKEKMKITKTLIKNKSLDNTIINNLIEERNPEIILEILKNKSDIKSDTLEEIAETVKDYRVYEQIGKHYNTSTNTLKKLLDMDFLNLDDLNKLDEKEIEKATEMINKVKRAVANNKNTDKKTLKQLMQDSDDTIAMEAKINFESKRNKFVKLLKNTYQKVNNSLKSTKKLPEGYKKTEEKDAFKESLKVEKIDNNIDEINTETKDKSKDINNIDKLR